MGGPAGRCAILVCWGCRIPQGDPREVALSRFVLVLSSLKSSYYNTPVEYKQKAGSGAYAEVDRNTRLARDLESQASKSTTITGNEALDMMIPGYGTLTNVSAFSKRQQASALRGGGNPVYDTKGDYQGVVSKNFLGGNVYSGNAAYSPIGRSQGATFDSATGTYKSSQIQR